MNKKVSIIDPATDDERGATDQCSFLNASKILISMLWAIKKARPEPMAIRIEIISEKFVDISKVKNIPITNPIYTTFLATVFPYARLDKSVIKNVIG